MSFFEKFGRSASELRSVRCITATGILIALDLVLKMLSIKITSDLKITFAYLALATVGMLFGPVVAFIAGALTDIIGFFLTADGGFSPLFTVVEAVGAMIYGIFLYDIKPVSFGKGTPEKPERETALKSIFVGLGIGAVTAVVFGVAMYVIGNIFSAYIEAEGNLGKVARLLTQFELVYVALAAGFLYGILFTIIIMNGKRSDSGIVSSLKIILSKVAVVVICNLILTPIAMVSSGYMTADSMIGAYPLRVVKNAIQCPVDCLLLLMVMFPILSAYRKIFPESGKRKTEEGGDTVND